VNASSSMAVLPRAVAGLVAATAGAYIVARAVAVPITYDEATSFFRYVDAEPTALTDFAAATNHLLNSALTRVARAAFGSAPWSLRLPNVLAGLLFLATAYRFAHRAAHPAIGAAGAVLLATNPYVLDYFALSRGYGLALGLLTASWVVWARWWAASADAARPRDLTLALVLSAAAVTASFSVLPAFVALVAMSTARLAWRARHAPSLGAGTARPVWSWTAGVAWVLLASTFTALVFARQRVPAEDAFAPISIRIAGLFPFEREAVEIFRYDISGRLRALPRRADGSWNSGPVYDQWQLRVVLPAAAERNLALLEVTAGAATFARSRHDPGPWTVDDFDDYRVLTSTSALRWRGDAAHRRFVATHTATTVAGLAALVAGLMLLARVAVRRHLADAEARAMAWTTIAVATVAAAPIYLLRRGEQLFFGGSTGLVADTVTSLVRGTTYGADVPAAVVGLVPWAMLAILLLPLAIAATARRSRQTAAFRAAGAVAGLLALCLAQVWAQHAILDTPFPVGRTALYLLPLAVIALVWAADALAARGDRWRRAATATIAVLAAVSVWNGVRAANLSQALDWPRDGAVPAMLQEVLADADPTSPRSRPTRLGVDWPFYPTARYYAERLPPGATRIEPVVLPGDGLPFEFGYGPPRRLPPGGTVIAQHGVDELHRLPR
jgi:hypothetical protein